MQQSAPSSVSEFVTSISQQRHALLRRAGEVMLGAAASHDASPGESTLAQCLLTSLEELKVMEEEIVAQNEALVAAQAEAAAKVGFFTTLFETAPCPLLLTTIRGVIMNANHAAGALTTRSPYYLEGKPIAAMIVKEKREAFRAQFERLVEVGGVTNWQITLDRQSNVPVAVSATVQVVPTILHGTPALYWALREV